MAIPHFIYSNSSADGYLGCFHILVMEQCCYEHENASFYVDMFSAPLGIAGLQ
jgi:hypothetical protein